MKNKQCKKCDLYNSLGCPYIGADWQEGEECDEFREEKFEDLDDAQILFPYLYHSSTTAFEHWQIIYVYHGEACVTKNIYTEEEALKEFERIKNLKE